MTTPIGAHLAGSYRRNKAGTPGDASGHIATVGGDPATWKPVGFLPKTTTQTGATGTIAKTDRTTLANRAGVMTLTLPASTDGVEEGAFFIVKDISAAGAAVNPITVEPGAGTTFEGGASLVIAENGGGAMFWLDGTVWRHVRLSSGTNAIASVTTVATPASGSVGVQFTFKDAAGVAVRGVRALTAYLSSAAGAHVAAQTSFAALVNGSLSELTAGKVALITTTAAGLAGITLTAATGDYYVSFVLPDGRIITSSILTVNA